MYLIVTTLYPNDKLKETAKMYLEAMKKYPDDASLATPVVQAAVRTTIQGVRVISIVDVKKGKFEDAYALVVKRMRMFDNILWLRWVIKPYYNLEEAMKTIDM
jgi:hypothetical protein